MVMLCVGGRALRRILGTGGAMDLQELVVVAVGLKRRVRQVEAVAKLRLEARRVSPQKPGYDRTDAGQRRSSLLYDLCP
jgi:hypothetical protein